MDALEAGLDRQTVVEIIDDLLEEPLGFLESFVTVANN
jgi:hypothetical protein